MKAAFRFASAAWLGLMLTIAVQPGAHGAVLWMFTTLAIVTVTEKRS